MQAIARATRIAGSGIREDPATGSACAAFAPHLRAQGAPGRFTIEQGFEIARPARIYLSVDATNEIGGRVRAVAEGRLF